MLPLLALILAAPPQAFRLPDVPHVKQKPDFCGEACLEMALSHFGRAGTQDDAFAWSRVAPEKGRGAWTAELKVAAEQAGFDTGAVWYAVDAQDPAPGMQKLLDAALDDLRGGSPSIFCMHYSDASGSPEHFRLLVGYDDGGATLLFEDPAVASGPTRFTKKKLFELWPLKYGADEWTMIRLRLKPVRPTAPLAKGSRTAELAQHVLAAKEKYGKSVDDLAVVVEPPFVVWGDTAAQARRSAEHTVRWTVRQLEAEYFAKQPDGVYDVFLFENAESYERHAKALWGDSPSTPYGYASAAHHALVMNIGTGGGTLVHEMVHPYLDANFQGAPTWLNEGLASLYEQASERDGRIIGLTNWRLAGLQAALKKGRVQPFARLVASSDAEFRGPDEGLNYAQARYLMMYLQEEGLLKRFVARALQQQRQDPTASKALIETLGAERWKGLDAAWKKWLLTLSFDG